MYTLIKVSHFKATKLSVSTLSEINKFIFNLDKYFLFIIAQLFNFTKLIWQCPEKTGSVLSFNFKICFIHFRGLIIKYYLNHCNSC